MVELVHLRAGDQSGIIEALTEHGGCIVEGLLDDQLCDQLMTDFKPHLETMPWGVDELGYKSDFYGSRTKRLHGLFSKSVKMAEVLTHPNILPIVQSVLLSNNKGRDVRLSNTELMVLAEHQAAQEFHTDGGSWYRAQAQDKEAGEEILVSTKIVEGGFTVFG